MSALRPLAVLGLALAACGGGPRPEDSPRVVEDTARGVRYTCPAGWKSSDGEIRSKEGSLLTLRVYDLVEADKKFVAGLPDTLVPQLKEWAELYYSLEGEPARTPAVVASVPATEFVYPVRVRKKDPQTKVIYWVVTRETRLFILRAAFPANALAKDEPVIRNVVDRWEFL